MKLRFLFMFTITLIGAVVAGWFFDRSNLPSVQNPLQIPDNIDYYLSGVKLKTYDQQGSPSYQLNTPYLEHFVVEDISIIQQPDIRYFSEKADWLMSAEQGKLIHQSEIIELQQKASIKRQQFNSLMHLTSEQMIFNPDQETVKFPVALRMQDEKLDLKAQSAMLDMKHEYHVFQRVNATYQTVKTHEPS
jgi:LPS export ABC transporter protein LptC